jgi:UDPglucose 6-dehydrogenase
MLPEQSHPHPATQSIAVIGTGYVGMVTGAMLAEIGHDVTCIDNDARKIAAIQQGRLPIYEPGLDELVERLRATGRLHFTSDIVEPVRRADVVFICVGTPAMPSGKADLSYIEQVSRAIAANLVGYTVIVEKSTVPVHTGLKVKRTIERAAAGRDFDVASNPEFLAEGRAVHDALNPNRIVIGVDSQRARAVLEVTYAPLAARSRLIVTTIESAEIIKHASNSFLALKISYINAVARVCELAGADIVEVATGMGLDERIGPQFLRAGIGYGGSCFPKDVDAFYDIATELGYEFSLLKEAQRINAEQRSWFIRKIEQALWVVKGKRVALLGLSFKPDTDDLREAPALDVASWLVAHGAEVVAHDPVAIDKAREHPSLRGVTFVSDPYLAVADADALVLLTEWRDYRDLEMARLRQAMRQPILLDARNHFDPAAMRALGFEYHGVGRSKQAHGEAAPADHRR